MSTAPLLNDSIETLISLRILNAEDRTNYSHTCDDAVYLLNSITSIIDENKNIYEMIKDAVAKEQINIILSGKNHTFIGKNISFLKAYILPEFNDLVLIEELSNFSYVSNIFVSSNLANVEKLLFAFKIADVYYIDDKKMHSINNSVSSNK